MCGIAGGVVVFWDNGVLELTSMVVGQFSISCRFRNCDDVLCGFLRGFMVPF